MSESTCLFCRIVAGSVPSETVLETETVLAFRDIAPHAPTHVLVIPKRHIASLADTSPEDRDVIADLIAATTEVARVEGRVASGFRVVMNSGGDGGQTVHHLHAHVLGGRPMAWPPG